VAGSISPEGGLGIALDQISRRKEESAQTQRLLQMLAQAKWEQDMREQDRSRRLAAQSRLGDLSSDIANFKPQDGPQPMPPGQSSMPMAPPGAPPGGPPGAPPGAPPGGPNPPQPMITQPMGPPGAPMGPDSWKKMPTEAGPQASGPAGMPPKEAPKDESVMPRRTMSVGDLSKLLAAKGIKGQDAFDMLEAWKPFMDDDNKTQLRGMVVENNALKAAVTAYNAQRRMTETERENEQKDAARKVSQQQADQRIDIARDKMHAAGAKAAGGEQNVKSWEDIYPLGPDGKPDTSQPPVGARGRLKSGRQIVVDNTGNVKAGGELPAGGTSKEAKAGAASDKSKQNEQDKERVALNSQLNTLQHNLVPTAEDKARMEDIKRKLKSMDAAPGTAAKGGAAPAAEKPPAGVPDGSKKIGKTPDGKDVWQSPDGKNWTG
jgi:hypothetical protein